MRVIPTACPDTNAALLDAFRHHLADRDLAPATIQAYLSDLTRFHAWLTWVHEEKAPLLTQVRTVDLAAFRTHLIHEQGHPPATVNRRLQGLRLLFRWLVDRHWMAENPTTPLRFGSVSKVEMVTPMALIYKVLFSSISTFETLPHRSTPAAVRMHQADHNGDRAVAYERSSMQDVSEGYGGARALSSSVCRQVTLSSPDVFALLRHHEECVRSLS